MAILDKILGIFRSNEEHFHEEQPVENKKKVFISYRQQVQPDGRVATNLRERLKAEGYDVFIDQILRVGDKWGKELERRIKTSDFLIVLLSEQSVESEMVQAEIRRAHEYCKRQGKPHTLPVRVAYKGLLPLLIDACLDPVQYVLWRNEADNERVAQEILAAMGGRLLDKEPIQMSIPVEDDVISEDGRPIADDETLMPPLPKFDPRFLESITDPKSGPVKLRDRLYIEREADSVLERRVVKRGTTTTIRAPRQTGKTSLLVRGLHHARASGITTVLLNLEIFDSDRLSSHGSFLHDLALFVVSHLELDEGEVERAWGSSLGAQAKITGLFEDYVLPACDGPLVLAMDEADRLLEFDYYQDFFGLVRAWHNSRAVNDQWKKFNIVLVISTEPFLLISDLSQSPFNVGRTLHLEDFTKSQVLDLNQRHGSPVKEPDFPELMRLLNGHPFLTRLALYELIDEQMPWADLSRVAHTDNSPFSSHLQYYYWRLYDKPELKEALKQVIRQERCEDEWVFYRLLQTGLLKGSSDRCTWRCDLYRKYFQEKL